MLRSAVRCREASAYTLGNWPELIHFLDDAHPAHNNATERSIRGSVVGRRNHFGSTSRRGIEVSATLYAVSETDIDPAAYLHVAVIAADRGELLLPEYYATTLSRCGSGRGFP